MENGAAKSASDLKLSKLAMEILEHLKTQKRACDTLTGIARFWIMKHRIDAMTRDVMKALSELIDLRLVACQNGADGQTTYRLNRRKLRQVNSLLGGARQGGAG